MHRRIRVLVLLLSSIVLAGCAANSQRPSAAAGDATTVKGQIAYRERIALVPGSHARVRVEDVAIADRKAPVIASQTLDLAERGVPAAFELVIPRDKLAPHGRYSLRAMIIGPDGRLLWTTDTHHPVHSDRRVNDLGLLMLKRVHSDSRDREAADRPLTGVEWVVEDIANAGIIDFSRVTLNFDTDGRLYGRASCNQYSGTYELEGDQLSVGRTTVTMKACAPALNNQERRFLDVLEDARGFEIDGTEKLIIHTAAGSTLEAYPQR
ncbi:hypothetical protein SADO_02590 [Salinisphaera dokdonensis CL-ES53]|uniref:DUF306 domain-containing protein n=1 Tax=Salinisphaera dokdonensis CL-ES53 TaxID=1304272 RepID=A0ABV2AXW9_9GAMM